jgi:hypothetical protein
MHYRRKVDFLICAAVHGVAPSILLYKGWYVFSEEGVTNLSGILLAKVSPPSL